MKKNLATLIETNLFFSLHRMKQPLRSAFAPLTAVSYRKESPYAILLKTGLPDISWCNIPKRGKIYQMATNDTKWP
jgi:hypothetical protein